MKKAKIDPIAIAIKNMITEKGFIKKTIALKAGYTPKQFYDMLNGKKAIKATDITPIAHALGISPQDIYDAGLTHITEE